MFYFANGRNPGQCCNTCRNSGSCQKPGLPQEKPLHRPKAEGGSCEQRDGHKEREEKKCRPQQGGPKHEEKKEQKDCGVCREIRPCGCKNRNSIQVNCPELFRWALWSSGFFRCNQCEQSGWQRRRGGGFS